MLRQLLLCEYGVSTPPTTCSSRTANCALAKTRSDRDGPNELEEKEENALLQVGVCEPKYCVFCGNQRAALLSFTHWNK